MDMTITSVTALLLAALFMLQTFSVIAGRRSKGVVHGDGGDKTMLKRIRGQANSAEQMPLFLILLGLLEYRAESSPLLLALIAALFVLGRMGHGAYFLNIGFTHHFRRYGMVMTLLAQLFAMILLAISLVG